MRSTFAPSALVTLAINFDFVASFFATGLFGVHVPAPPVVSVVVVPVLVVVVPVDVEAVAVAAVFFDDVVDVVDSFADFASVFAGFTDFVSVFTGFTDDAFNDFADVEVATFGAFVFTDVADVFGAETWVAFVVVAFTLGA